ncbi:hypothetical protein VTL71DRAFT_8908 [Oculimacula yallundae]|uniref:2EXR domain-containing protein n=1 Tax=Oculimacula yallundae TaxID=86028 RepID=A0ABR4BUR7_9HELO
MATPETPPLAQALTLADLVLPEPRVRSARTTSARIKRLQDILGRLYLLKEQNNILHPTSGAATTFHLFPKLPMEIRIKVFREILDEEVIFAIGWDNLHPWLLPWIKQRVGSWHDFEIHDIRVTGKGSLLHVNAEARAEAKRFLRNFEFRGRGTWVNAATDVAWFPRFNSKDVNVCHEGFLVGHTIQYKSWPGNPHHNLDQRKFDYRFVGEKGLKEVVLAMTSKDLTDVHNRKDITAASKPPSVLLDDPCQSIDLGKIDWAVMEREEMHSMTEWIVKRDLYRNRILDYASSADYPSWVSRIIERCPETKDDVTIPNISFCLEKNTSLPSI